MKLNVDEAPAVAKQFSVMNIPTILAFEGGALKQRIVGAMPKAKLTRSWGRSWAEAGMAGLSPGEPWPPPHAGSA